MNYDWLKSEPGPKAIVEAMKLKKNCVSCGVEYVSNATKRMRKGNCKSCRHAKIRSDYYEKHKGTGRLYYYDLLRDGKKKCTKCKEVKLIDLFSYHYAGVSLRSTCKACDNASKSNKYKHAA